VDKIDISDAQLSLFFDKNRKISLSIISQQNPTENSWNFELSPKQVLYLHKILQKQIQSIQDTYIENQLSSYISSLMIEIPSYEGIQGVSNDDKFALPNEKPSFQVKLPQRYEMCSVPVTQQLYKWVMKENPSYFQHQEKPVEMVSWFDAVRFCNQLSKMLNIEPAYEIEKDIVHWNRDSCGFRLPTEAEWESVVHIGTPQKLRYWEQSLKDSSVIESLQNYAHFASPNQGTLRVGQKLPNNLGIYDIIGNIFEWCWDELSPYTDLPKVYPISNSMKENQQSIIRICRGGSWNRDAWFLRRTYRYGDTATTKAKNIGFRIVRFIST
jgi:formylglycine-generating enzyme required for sulfatase activity